MHQPAVLDGTYNVVIVKEWPASNQAVIRWPKCPERGCRVPMRYGSKDTVVSMSRLKVVG